MTDPSTESNEARAARRATASEAERAVERATAPAVRAANSAADRTADKASDAASAAKSGADRAADKAEGAANGVARGVEAGRQTLAATTGQVADTAKTAWTAIAQRKLVAAGVGAGVTVLTAASYAAGRRSGRHAHGPITRLTGGRI
ncbi:hypothetical protein [Streptomyces antibioticus]|nr:hypothetical protein [Streptomyces antibioticus]